ATRARPHNPALDDPRSNTARASPEARFAAALGSADGALVEEPLGDDRRRIRQGGACVIATPARVSQLFPFDDSATRAPQKIEPC
ncbi:MAG TPA: hypothetical protein VNU71_12150, partial [Burkholderiaceae bacterium]|nr:hypothetical protein [Burkholderiaceae bacterium]